MMQHRQQDRARDDRLDAWIDRMLAGKGAIEAKQTTSEQVAREFARLAAEESSRMSNGARAQGLEQLRARARQKRAARRPGPFAFLRAVPRWVQIGAVALLVVVLANGVTIAAADALPGSLLYPLKRFTEGGQLLLQNSNGQRAQLWMNLANTRLDELQGLLDTGARVDPASLDAVDESILRALTELAGTRGQERVALLQELTALSIRQQQILRRMASNASPLDRARLEQTERLLEGVANYATSPDAVIGPEISPLQFLTPTVTPTITPSPTTTITPLPTPTAVPSSTAVPAANTDDSNDNSDNTNANGNAIGGNDNANSGNTNANDNSGDDSGGDNGNDNGGDNGNDNDDANGNANDNDDDSGSGNGNDNDDGNSGSGSGNGNDDDNSGSGDGGSDDDNSVSGNGSGDDDDNSGSGNGGGDDDDKSGSGGGGGDDDDDNSGSGGGGDGDDKDEGA